MFSYFYTEVTVIVSVCVKRTHQLCVVSGRLCLSNLLSSPQLALALFSSHLLLLAWLIEVKREYRTSYSKSLVNFCKFGVVFVLNARITK